MHIGNHATTTAFVTSALDNAEALIDIDPAYSMDIPGFEQLAVSALPEPISRKAYRSELFVRLESLYITRSGCYLYRKLSMNLSGQKYFSCFGWINANPAHQYFASEI